MTSANDFLMGFMKELVHVKNTDTRPQIVQQWAEKLEAREAELRREFYERFVAGLDNPSMFVWDGNDHDEPAYSRSDIIMAAKKAAGIQ